LRLDVTIASLAPGGDGVAHVDIDGERRAVFLPQAAPGDVLRAEVDVSTRPARGRLLGVIAPGPERVTPACAWSTRCGGCDWMHLSLRAQEQTHVEHVRAALPGGWQGASISSHPAPVALGYRTRTRVHVRRAGSRVVVGMHGARTHDPVEVDVCVVLDPAVERGRRRLAGLFEGSPGRGEVEVALGAGRVPVLDVRWRGDLASQCFARLEEAVSAGDLAGARVTTEGSSRPATIGDPTPWTTGADGAPLRGTPGGFSQANERCNALLARHVAELVRARRPEQAVELFAGSGNFSVLLAREVPGLTLVESSREACETLRINLRMRGLRGRVVEADAGEYGWSAAAKLVVLDPPRTGARAVAERLAASHVRHVVYVSCDPQTLRRDLAILANAYELRSVATFEMFPQTSHAEAVVALDRRARR